jgi:predicted Zn-dependent peptidase
MRFWGRKRHVLISRLKKLLLTDTIRPRFLPNSFSNKKYLLMTERLDKHILKNGMVLLGEPMEEVASVAFGFMLPSGAAVLPEGCCGAGGVIADWIFRGAGDKNSRQLGDALDGLGLARSRSVGSSHITVGAALEAGNLAQALDLYADIILKPSLEEDQFELARQLAVDGLLSLDDDPRQKVMLKLREQFYPSPLGRSPVGEIAELKTLTAEKAKQIINDRVKNFDG